MSKASKPLDIRSERESARIGPRELKDITSVAYAWQTIEYLKTKFQITSLSIRDWEEALREAEQARIYERVPPEHPYGSLDALLKAEIGMSVQQSVGDVLARHGGDHKSELFRAKRENQHSNSRLIYGTTAAYTTARIARDRPDLHSRVLAGELSPHAAAIEAGFRTRTITIPIDVERAAAALTRHFTLEQLAALCNLLAEELDDVRAYDAAKATEQEAPHDDR